MTKTASPELATGFRGWAVEAEQLDQGRLPESEVAVIALVGIYVATTNLEQRTIYDWRQAVLQDEDVMTAFRPFLNTFEIDDFDFPYSQSVEDIAELRADSWGQALQTQWEYRAALDGVPESVTTIASDEYRLSKIASHAAHNSAVWLDPLRLNMPAARPPLDCFFPLTLGFIEARI